MINLRWSWNPETQDLFDAVDPDAWRPATTTRCASWLRPGAASAGARGGQAVHQAARARRGRPRRVHDRQPLVPVPRSGRPGRIGYFSPEFGITAVLPQYSGGLGILAGDHLKSASDLGVPILGVGLLYRHGYFRQSLSRDGWQQERYPLVDPDELPLTLLPHARRQPARISSRRARRPARCVAHVWVAQVGRVPLLLMDSDIEDNPPAAARVTDRLYGGGSDHRLLQELLLGIGGVRAIRTYCEITGARGARGVPHQRGARRFPRHRADPRVHRGRRARLRRGRSRRPAPAPSSRRTRRCPPASTASRAS